MGIDVQQRRIVIGIILATLATCALFLAQGTTNLLATTLLPLEGSSAIAQPPGAGATRERDAVLEGDEHDIKGILKRNIFDSQTGPLWPPALEPELPTADEDEVAETDVFDPSVMPPACDGSVKLVAAVVSRRRPDWSFAALHGSEGKTLLYREGMSVDEHEVVNIYPNAVYLRPADGMCSLTLFEDPSKDDEKRVEKKKRSKPKRRARKRARRSGGAVSDEMLEEGIEKKSETKYVIARSLVDTVLQNQAELMRTARIIPHEQGGQVVGVKLYGIRRNSLLGKLGINNGDVLRTINGFDMTSPDTALEAYARLRNADQLTVSVQRRGRAMNLEYDIE